MNREKSKSDYSRIKNLPLEVILFLDNIKLEDEADRFLREEQGLVDAYGKIIGLMEV